MELDQSPCLVAESLQPLLVALTVLVASRPNRGSLANREFNRQVLLDRHDNAQLVVSGPVDDSESAVSDDRLDCVVAQDCARRKAVVPLFSARRQD